MQKLSDYTMLSSEKSSTDAIDSDITLPRPNSCISVNYSNIIVNNNDGSVKTTTNPLLKKDVTLGHDLDQQEKSLSFDSRISESKEPLPDMWSRNYIGLYCQYAAVGLIYGSTGTLIPFCAYTFNGPANVCANARNIVTFAWNIKIFYAIFTDIYRPFGLRRKPYMLCGWVGVLVLLLVLTFTSNTMSLTAWLVSQMAVNGFVMLSDVPSDGYCVELGQMEPFEKRGQILATGQRIRFSFCVIAGIIQTFLLNGPSTNESGCEISFQSCWAWGLTINGYFGLLFAIVFVLAIPICWLKELEDTHVPRHTASFFFKEIWLILQNMTTFYILIFILGIQTLTNFTSNANIQLQYYVIKLTNFQAGIDTVTTYAGLAYAIWLFQTYMINRDWHITQYMSVLLAALLGLVWIAPYYNLGGTQNGWFTIFIDLDTQFAQGLSQVLYTIAIIELAKTGLEATTFELLVTVGNAALLVNGVISTQMLTPLNAVSCDEDGGCGSHTVSTTSQQSFNDSDGPWRYTQYTLILNSISVAACFIFTPFLPKSKEQCHEWKLIGDQQGNSIIRARIGLAMCVVTILYGVVAAVLLLNTSTACLPEIGGAGC